MKLVILSGGLDSVVLLHWVLANSESNADVDTIMFDYGQKHKKELVYAKYWTQLFNLGSMVYDLNGMFHDSALLGDRAMPYNDEDMSPTVVPGRNMVFISVAASRAMADGYSSIYIGTNKDDRKVYPDCRFTFLEGMATALYKASEGKVSLEYPFANMTKKQIVELGMQLNVDFDKTWSCYLGGDKQCGVCGACQSRIKALS